MENGAVQALSFALDKKIYFAYSTIFDEAVFDIFKSIFEDESVFKISNNIKSDMLYLAKQGINYEKY